MMKVKEINNRDEQEMRSKTMPRNTTRMIARSRTKTRATTPKTPWTVLVWIAGDNNLDTFGLKDMKEMKKVGSTSSLNIVTQFDRAGTGGTRRYFLRKGTSLSADIVQSLGETNTGDPRLAIDFSLGASGTILPTG